MALSRALKLDGFRMARTTDRQAPTDDRQSANDNRAGRLKRLAHDTYELDAFKPNLTRAEADKRIAMLTAKHRLLGEPPHTL